MNRKSAAVFVWLFCVALSVNGQQPGNIRGTVVDETEKPVSAAQIIVDPADDRPQARGLRVAEADADGKFVMKNLPLGIYKVFAKKDSAGYPDTSFAFYSNNAFPTVTLTGGVPVAEVVLKVGPPAGVVEGTIRDAASGDPVHAGLLLRRASDPNNFISMSQPSDYRVLVPPDVDVLVEVSSPGYKTWYYGGTADLLKRAPVRLESRKEMRLDVELQRDEKPPDQ